MALEGTRQGKFTQLVPHHVLGDEHRHELVAVVDRDRVADELRWYHTSPRIGLDRALLSRLDRLGQLLENIALVVMLGGMILLAFGQIILRNFLDTGFIWIDPLLRVMVLWIGMIGALAVKAARRAQWEQTHPTGEA